MAQSRARYVALGHGADAFGPVHDAAFDATMKQVNSPSAPQQAPGCEQLKAFGVHASQMAEDMLEKQRKSP